MYRCSKLSPREISVEKFLVPEGLAVLDSATFGNGEKRDERFRWLRVAFENRAKASEDSFVAVVEDCSIGFKLKKYWNEFFLRCAFTPLFQLHVLARSPSGKVMSFRANRTVVHSG